MYKWSTIICCSFSITILTLQMRFTEVTACATKQVKYQRYLHKSKTRCINNWEASQTPQPNILEGASGTGSLFQIRSQPIPNSTVLEQNWLWRWLVSIFSASLQVILSLRMYLYLNKYHYGCTFCLQTWANLLSVLACFRVIDNFVYTSRFVTLGLDSPLKVAEHVINTPAPPTLPWASIERALVDRHRGIDPKYCFKNGFLV